MNKKLKKLCFIPVLGPFILIAFVSFKLAKVKGVFKANLTLFTYILPVSMLFVIIGVILNHVYDDSIFILIMIVFLLTLWLMLSVVAIFHFKHTERLIAIKEEGIAYEEA